MVSQSSHWHWKPRLKVREVALRIPWAHCNTSISDIHLRNLLIKIGSLENWVNYRIFMSICGILNSILTLKSIFPKLLPKLRRQVLILFSNYCSLISAFSIIQRNSLVECVHGKFLNSKDFLKCNFSSGWNFRKQICA